MKRDKSKVGSGFGKNISNWVDRKEVYPDNVLHLATECNNKNHSAAFPESLPEWFIKLFTDEGDWVLDPFLGSGTSCIVARKLRRNSIGFELNEQYYWTAQKRVNGIENISDKLSEIKLLEEDKDEEQMVISL
jgi:DNA modification methylase